MNNAVMDTVLKILSAKPNAINLHNLHNLHNLITL